MSNTERSSADTAEPVSFGRRISDHAAARPDETGFVFIAEDGVERPVSWRELDGDSNRVARLLDEQGVGQESLLAVALPNSVEHIVATIASWKLGACVVPVRWDLPEWERGRVLDVLRPDVIVAEWPAATGTPIVTRETIRSAQQSADPLPDRVPHPVWGIATSGSTGTPKVIIRHEPGAAVPGEGFGEAGEFLGYRARQVQIILAPLYHANGFYPFHMGLFGGQLLVLMERFDAARAVELIERHRVNTFCCVPIMLQRMARLPDIAARDLSSLESVLQGGAVLPEWVARFWTDLVGPTQFFVAYSSGERVGMTKARGDELLERPGTVGRPFKTDLRIVDEEGRELPSGAVGEIYMRWADRHEPIFEYRGAAPPRTTPDGLVSLGDLGWVDDDGYLYIADRRVDLIISGGANVYPAEVEAALTEHPGVADAAVVGLPDEEWGRRVHAIVQPADPASPPTSEELRQHCKERLAAYKVPKTIELGTIPRTQAGKIRRSALVDERSD